MTAKASATKILIQSQGSHSREQLDRLRQDVADTLGVLADDVVFLPGLGVSVIEVPAELTARREKADREAEAEAEKTQKERAKAEKAALEKQQAAEVEAVKKQQAEIAGTEPAPASPAPEKPEKPEKGPEHFGKGRHA